MEERQIFQSIVEAATDDPNAAACLCKLALAVEDSPESVPNASSAAAVYVANSAAVHARCRLNQDEELKLIGMVRQEQTKKSAVKRVLSQSDGSIVKQAAKGTHAKGAQAKLVEELLRSVQEETTAAGVGVALTLILTPNPNPNPNPNPDPQPFQVRLEGGQHIWAPRDTDDIIRSR